MTRQTKKIEKIKIKLNPQWLEQYSLVTVRREVWYYDILTVYQK